MPDATSADIPVGGTDVAGAIEPPAARRDTGFKKVPNHAVITITVMLATIMQALDNTIANVALPRMQGSLSATQDEMGWVLTSYIIGAAITIPLSGWLANEFGRRRVFLTSIVLFTAASALCGIAETLPQIVIFRFLQGVGGAALIPLSQAVLFDINAPKDFGRAMAVWSSGSNLGPILGPMLGGWLTDNYSWRWVFYINLPIGVLTFVGLLLTLPESRNAKSSRFDFFGFATLSLSIAALQLLLDRGQLLDWFSSGEIILEAIFAGLGLYLFLVHMFSTPKPFINPALFRDRNFVASNVFSFLNGIVLYATLALLPPMLQNQLQYPVVLTGIVTAPRGLGALVSLIVVGRLVTRFDARVLMAIGLAIMAYSLWEMTQYSMLMGYWPVVISGVCQGLSIGFIYVPLSTVAFTTLPSKLRNEGTALFNLLRNVGSSIGISVMLFLLTQNTQRVHAALASDVTPYNVASNPAVAAAHIDATTLTGLVALNSVVTNQATMIAYIDDFRLMMVMALLAIPFVLLIKNVKPGSGTHLAVLE